jgi:hypothetical protein
MSKAKKMKGTSNNRRRKMKKLKMKSEIIGGVIEMKAKTEEMAAIGRLA